METSFKLKQALMTLNQHNYVASVAGIRPFRKGGLRIQIEKLKDKFIVHNYGHGGAGISLAPATAQQATSIMLNHGADYKSQKIAVLGSGVNGLFSALESAKMGYQVIVYAQRIPQAYSINSLKMCTSQVPPGYWLPYSYQYQNQSLHEQRSTKSYKEYLKLSRLFGSVNYTNVYEAEDQNFNINKLPIFLKKYHTKSNLVIGPINQKTLNFPSIQINLQPFLADLIKVCHQYGVQFCQKTFKSIEDITNIPQKYIINCLGLGSKYIFNDTKMYGAKGYLLRFKNKSNIKWGIYGLNYKQHRLKFYFLPDKIFFCVLEKISTQDKQIDQSKIKEIKNILNEFLMKSQVCPMAKL